MDNNLNNIQNENLSNTNRINVSELPANKTGKQIKQEQDDNRGKYQTEFNQYHDKNKITDDSKVVVCVLVIVVLIIALIVLLSIF